MNIITWVLGGLGLLLYIALAFFSKPFERAMMRTADLDSLFKTTIPDSIPLVTDSMGVYDSAAVAVQRRRMTFAKSIQPMMAESFAINRIMAKGMFMMSITGILGCLFALLGAWLMHSLRWSGWWLYLLACIVPNVGMVVGCWPVFTQVNIFASGLYLSLIMTVLVGATVLFFYARSLKKALAGTM
jgi:hypothetical protein